MSTNLGEIYTGFWIDWTEGRITGSRLTLTTRDSNYLLSFLGVFITLVATQFWEIVGFCLHSWNTKLENDGLGRQHQIILRNSGSAAGTARELLFLPFAWRPGTYKMPPGRFLLRSWSLALIPLGTFAAFSAAGILSSQITKSVGDNVLIVDANCGMWQFLDVNDVLQQRAFVTKVVNESLVAANYAKYCYHGPSTSSLCNTYAKQQLPWGAERLSSCPFANEMCHQSENASLRLDTGYLDSHLDLGLNTPPKDRILFRRVTTCAPLDNADRWEEFAAVGLHSYRYNFGPSLGEWTYEYDGSLTNLGQGYYINDWLFEAGTQPNEWTPLPELARPDADLSLVSLSPNTIQYLAPIDDPFFSAHKMVRSDDMTSWKADGPEEFVHFMACADQHQFCMPQAKNSPGPETCTQLSGHIHLCDSLDAIPFGDTQLATAVRICSQLRFSLMDEAVFGLGPLALLAQEHLVTLISDALPIDQWMQEVSYWFAISLSRIQHGLVEYAAGPTEIPQGMVVIPPSDEAGRQLCKAQMIRANGHYQSFSVLGLCLTLAIGVVIVFTSWILEPVTNFVRKTYLNDRKTRRIQWLLDGKLQLLRMAHEYAGVGDWIKKDEETPVVQNLDKVFVFPVNPNASDPGWREPRRIQVGIVPLSGGQEDATPENKPLISSHTPTDEENRD